MLINVVIKRVEKEENKDYKPSYIDEVIFVKNLNSGLHSREEERLPFSNLKYNKFLKQAK